MLHYLIELAVWMLGSYFAGACIGCMLKKLFGADDVALAGTGAAVAAAAAVPVMKTPAYVPPVPPPPPPARPVVVEKPVAPPPPPVRPIVVEKPAAPVPPPPPPPARPVAAEKLEAAAAPLAAVGKMERPRGIAAARGGKADNLQRISGIGPKNEGILHSLGFFHFDQIAAWTSEQVNWVDDHLRFNGRIKREEWIRQARLLAEGKEAEFIKLYGTGGLSNRQGETLSGSRTRKT